MLLKDIDFSPSLPKRSLIFKAGLTCSLNLEFKFGRLTSLLLAAITLLSSSPLLTKFLVSQMASNQSQSVNAQHLYLLYLIFLKGETKLCIFLDSPSFPPSLKPPPLCPQWDTASWSPRVTNLKT